MKHYYKAHWEWFCENGSCYWRAPGGNNIGVVDLRSDTQAGKLGGVPAGFGVFAYVEPQNIAGAEYLGTEEPVVADLIWQKLTTEADPTGVTAPKPLTGKLGKEVAIYLAGKKLKSEAFTATHRQRTVDVFQADYRKNVGKYPKALLQKWVGAKMQEIYGEMSDENANLLVPAEHRKGVLWKKPATVIGDTFTDTNGTALESHTASGTGGGFSWSKLAGNSMAIQSNKLQRNATTGHGDRDYRADSDLSSADMYAKATVGSLGTDFDCAVSARFSSSARTHYQTEWGNGFRRISKFVAGAHSVLQSDGSSNTVGDVLECRVNGSTIQAYRNGAQVLTNQTDTSITGHVRAGLSIWHDQSTWDAFEASDLSTGATASPSVVTAVFSIIAVAITAGASIAPTTPNATFSIQNPTVSGGATKAVSELSGTFSIQSPAVIGGATKTATELTATFSAPTATASTDTATPSGLSAVFSIQAPSVSGSSSVAPTTSSVVFSVQSPSESGGAVAPSTTPNAIFSIQAPSESGSASLAPSTQNATFSVQNPSVSGDGGSGATASPSLLVAVFSIQQLQAPSGPYDLIFLVDKGRLAKRVSGNLYLTL